MFGVDSYAPENEVVPRLRDFEVQLKKLLKQVFSRRPVNWAWWDVEDAGHDGELPLSAEWVIRPPVILDPKESAPASKPPEQKMKTALKPKKSRPPEKRPADSSPEPRPKKKRYITVQSAPSVASSPAAQQSGANPQQPVKRGQGRSLHLPCDSGVILIDVVYKALSPAKVNVLSKLMGFESLDFSGVAPVPLIGRRDLDYERIRTVAAAHVTVDMVIHVKQQRWTSDSKSEKHECDASDTSQSNTATVFSEDEDEDSDIDETGEDLDIMDDLDAIPSASTQKWRREWADPRLEAKEPSESSDWGAENKPKRLPELSTLRRRWTTQKRKQLASCHCWTQQSRGVPILC